jgi:hypothetical protein
MDRNEEMWNRLQLRDLVERYAKGADTRDGDLWLQVFTKDALLNTSRGELIGHEALFATPPKLARYKATMHLVGNHYVEFLGDSEATGQAYCVAHHLRDVDGVEKDYVMMIRYDDHYVRVDGDWRIDNRKLNLLWEEDRPTKL